MLTDLIREAGVVGAGGAGFPTHVKLAASAEYFIVNAAECEPLIETDKFFCRNFAGALIEATAEVADHLQAKKAIIGIKRSYTKEVDALKKAIHEKNAAVELFLMDSFYPAGDEQILVHRVTGRSVPERGIPLEVGAVVDNVGTVLNIYNAMKGIPLTDKYLSVTGAVAQPIMIKAPLGTPILACIEAADIAADSFDVILGGPMMGKCVPSHEELAEKTVTKTTSNILLLPKGHYLAARAERPLRYDIRLAQTACIQCRFCTMQCPRYKIGHEIRPHRIMRAAFLEPQIDDRETYRRLYGGAVNCSECGVCEMFACPMGLSPRKVNIHFKKKLKEMKIEVTRNQSPGMREIALSGDVSTKRLTARLGLMEYGGKHAGDGCKELHPNRVVLPTSQHIGKPAVPVCQAGDRVTKGALVARAAEEGLSANIHASMDGIVEYVDQRKVVIRCDGSGEV